MNETRNKYPLIPEEERRCIWMTTGLISYKLCDRDYRCESCPLELALKNEENEATGFREPEEEWAEGSRGCDPSAGIHGSIFYHPDHCWVRVENPETVRIGIVDLLTRLMGDIRVVILPKVGSVAREGEYCAHIIQAEHILPVVSPLSGCVEAVNLRLGTEPELITADPKGEGWLITIRPNNLESDLKNLLFGRRALSWYRRAEKELMARVEQLLQHRREAAVGPTMQDGGVRVGRLQDLLRGVDARQRAQLLDAAITRAGDHPQRPPKPPG